MPVFDRVDTFMKSKATYLENSVRTVACPMAGGIFCYEIHCYGFLQDDYIPGAGQQLVLGLASASLETILPVRPGEKISGVLICTNADATKNMELLIYE